MTNLFKMFDCKATMLILVLMFPFIVSGDKYYIEHRKTFLAKEGSHVKVEVDHYPAKVRIEYRPSPDVGIKNFFEDDVMPGYKYSYNGTVGVFEILNITKENAGYYEFFYALFEGGGIEYAINIILADMRCKLDIKSGSLWKSDCSNVQGDKIGAWCGINLSEKTKERIDVRWGTKSGKRGNMKVIWPSENNIVATEVDVPLNEDDVFDCYASNMRCSVKFSVVNLLYAKNKTIRELTSYSLSPMTPDNIQPVTCRANVSQSVWCRYTWIYKDGDVTNEFAGNILQETDMKKDGIYECLAHCVLKEQSDDKCILYADRVEFSSQSKNPSLLTNHSANILLIVLIVLFSISSLVKVFRFVHR